MNEGKLLRFEKGEEFVSVGSVGRYIGYILKGIMKYIASSDDGTVRLHFSKPHKNGFGMSTGRSGELIDPEIVRAKKDENGVYLITFMLEPNMKYDFSFHGSLFRNEDMWPMKNTIYLTFETAPEN